MSVEHYDLIVLGSGPAGEKGAAQVAYFGKKVALIEREPVLGGAAANTGTLPSKTLRETCLFLSGFKQRQLFGIDLRGLKDKVTVGTLLSRERLLKETERARILANLKRHKVHLFSGTGSFLDAHTLSIKPQRAPECLITGDYVLIATGSYPYRPPVFPFHDPRVYDSDTILTLHEVPQSMIVIGGGVIGCEYACMFGTLGVQVTVIEKRSQLVGFLDEEIAESLKARMEALGIRVLLRDSVRSVRCGDNIIEVELQSGEYVIGQTVLVSSGRCGNTADLNLEGIGIQVGERGHIPVNEDFQTPVPHIYAAGDVIGHPALASTSMEQARVGMTHAFGFSYKDSIARVLPYGIFTIPEISMCGETEESLKKDKIPYVAGKALYSKNARGQIISDQEGFIKLLFREDDLKLVGVHVIGEQATEIVHVGLTAMLMNATAHLFIQTCYNYPTLTEMYKYAAYDALGRLDARKRRDVAI